MQAFVAFRYQILLFYDYNQFNTQTTRTLQPKEAYKRLEAIEFISTGDHDSKLWKNSYIKFL